jgi:hypothetical protein
MWFEMVEAADLAGDKDPAARVRTRRELVDRAVAAYAEAGEDVPAEHGERFDRWLADHPPSSSSLT